ncbi:hypothetical protein DFH06DRAFT_54342 [Mycena polygramma]|nr:hypothetical protein DFH06DRAFT_70508 [Mycena polygramma]KAJ7673088.1 hypothetical protein DFH06DRAFT_54342 [Mycena polygramma]
MLCGRTKHPYTPHPVFMLLALGQCILSSLYVLRTLLRDVSFPPLLFPPFSPRALFSVALLFYPSRLPHCHLLPCLRSLPSPRNSPSFFRLPPLKTARGALCASPIPQFPGWLRWAGLKNRFITYDNANARLCGWRPLLDPGLSHREFELVLCAHVVSFVWRGFQ